jgi:hypothetical protein
LKSEVGNFVSDDVHDVGNILVHCERNVRIKNEMRWDEIR